MSRPRISRISTLAFFGVLALGSACRRSDGDGADSGTAFRPLDVGTPVPSYAVRTLHGDTIRVGANEPVTLLNVWATWCTSCREEMASLDSLQREFGGRGLRVVGVSVDQGSDDRIRRFAVANHLGFAVGHDPAGDIQREYQVVGVPTSFIVGRDGRLLWRHVGNIDDAPGEARAALMRALATSGGAR